MMRHVRCLSAVVALLAGLAACAEPPKDYLELTGKVFLFNVRLADATIVVTLRKLKDATAGASLVTDFEDPAGGEPLRVTQKIWPGPNITIESPSLTCIVKGKPYAITIQLVDQSGTELQKIATTLASELGQEALPDRPLVVGPGYDANPALAGHANGKLPDRPQLKCPP